MAGVSPTAAPARGKRKARKANGSVRVLTRADILEADDVRIEPVPVPQWKGTTYVRDMSAASMADFDNLVADDPVRFGNPGNLAALLAVCTVCDDKGNLLFTVDDIDRLAAKSGEAVAAVTRVARRLNGLVNADELAKN